MKIKILQENLLKALSQTTHIISNKPQLPVLQNVLLQTHNGLLNIVATNMETTISTFAQAKVEKDGDICISARLLSELVVSLPQETVVLEEENGALSVSTTRTHASIPGVPASEFPPVRLPTGKQTQTLDKAAITDVLPLVLFAAATDEGRPLLTGVKVRQDKDGLLLAATDGYRLSVKRIIQKADASMDLVVPARALGEVVKIAHEEKEGGPIGIEKTEDNQLVFTIGQAQVATRLIDGEYPNFEKIIPKTTTTTCRFDKQLFFRAVKSAAIFARDNANIIKLHVEKGGVTVSANTPQVGHNTVDIEGTIDGDGGDIAFNCRFLLEFLNNFPEEELLFEMTGSLNPGVFKGVKDDSYLHVIMPVRVQQ